MTSHTGSATSAMLTGSFRNRAEVEQAYDALLARGYSKDEINVIMSDDTRKQHFSEKSETTELGTKAAEGGLTGATVGGTIGAVAGVLAMAGTLAIPGLGIVLAGPVAAGLVGLGAGAAAGGVVGTLIGAGIPEDRAKAYEEDIKKGGIVMGVNPRSPEDARHIETEWTGYRADNVQR